MNMGGDDDFFNSFGGVPTSTKPTMSAGAHSTNRPKLVVPTKMKGGLQVKKNDSKPNVKKIGGNKDPFEGLNDGWDNF